LFFPLPFFKAADRFCDRGLELAVQFNPDRCDRQSRDPPSEWIEHDA
jgi:hypothetical protein